jgi:hypothetical protein
MIIACCAIVPVMTGCRRENPNENKSHHENGATQQDSTLENLPWFREAASSGLIFEHHSGHRKSRYLFPEIMCGGAALFDMDNDGALDAYLVQSGSLTGNADGAGGNQLFRNNHAGQFRNITEGSGADDRGYGMGVAVGDYNNDAMPDLYVTNVGPDVLLKNVGDGRFVDVTKEAGLGHDAWGSSVTFLDFDADGHLDLFVVNYINWSVDTELECFNPMSEPDYCHPENYNSPAQDVLYRNNGDGTFTDVSGKTGIDKVFGNGLGVVAGDFNGDGRQDIFVANDMKMDQLWIQQADGSFKDEALLAGCAVDSGGQPKAGMGVASADLNLDGRPDLIVCNLHLQSDSLYLNRGGYFDDKTAMVGLGTASKAFTRFGVGFHDFDNDSHLDLFIANGRVGRKSTNYRSDDPYAEPNLLFSGLAGLKFEEVKPRGGVADLPAFTSRAAAFGDVNGDGAIDILVVNKDAPAQLLMNQTSMRHRSMTFRVINAHGADALGARVSIRFSGGDVLTQEVRSGYSYCAASDPRVHVGLGWERRTVEEVVVRWVDETRESFKFGRYFKQLRVYELRRGEGTPAEATIPQSE